MNWQLKQKIQEDKQKFALGNLTQAPLVVQNVNARNIIKIIADQHMNLGHLLASRIITCSYWESLKQVCTFSEIIEEIHSKVRNLEPWSVQHHEKKPSIAFVLLYKLLHLGITTKQLNAMLLHKDSLYIRAIGFLFLRFAIPQNLLIEWFSPHFNTCDQQFEGSPFDSFLEDLLQVPKFMGAVLFPRIPRPLELQVKDLILQAKEDRKRLERNRDQVDRFEPGVLVDAKFSQDSKWYPAVIREIANGGFFLVRFTEYGNDELVPLAKLKLIDEGRFKSRSRSRSKDGFKGSYRDSRHDYERTSRSNDDMSRKYDTGERRSYERGDIKKNKRNYSPRRERRDCGRGSNKRSHSPRRDRRDTERGDYREDRRNNSPRRERKDYKRESIRRSYSPRRESRSPIQDIALKDDPEAAAIRARELERIRKLYS